MLTVDDADGARLRRRRRDGARTPRSTPRPRCAPPIDGAGRGERDARDRQLAARVPRRAGAACTDVDWSRVTAFHMDEYVGLPPTHSASFQRYMRERVAATLPVEGVPLPHGRHRRRAGRGRPLRRVAARAPARSVLLRHRRERAPRVQRSAGRRLRRPARREDRRARARVAPPAGGEGHFATVDDVPTHAITVTIPALLRAAPGARDRARGAQGDAGARRAAGTDHDRVPGVDPAPPAARDAVPRRRNPRRCSTRDGADEPHDRRARYAQVLSFPSAAELRRRLAAARRRARSCSASSIAVSVRAQLGVSPWDVFHQGVAQADRPLVRRRHRARRARGAARVDPAAPAPRASAPCSTRCRSASSRTSASTLIPDAARARRCASRCSLAIARACRPRRRPLHRLRSRARTARRPDDRDQRAAATASGSCARRSSAACSWSASCSAVTSASAPC